MGTALRDSERTRNAAHRSARGRLMPNTMIMTRRKPANSVRWASGSKSLSAATEDNAQFDALVAKLGLAGQEHAWPWSKELQRFARQHKDSRFIPEWLLRQWGLEVRVRDTQERESA